MIAPGPDFIPYLGTKEKKYYNHYDPGKKQLQVVEDEVRGEFHKITLHTENYVKDISSRSSSGKAEISDINDIEGQGNDIWNIEGNVGDGTVYPTAFKLKRDQDEQDVK